MKFLCAVRSVVRKETFRLLSSALLFFTAFSAHAAVIVNCPDPIVAECAGTDGAPVRFEITATSTAGRISSIVANPPSGSTFPLGVTTVRVTATDALRNSAQCSFTVTVRDTKPPILNVPAPIEVLCAPAGGKIVEFAVTATDTCDSNLIPVCTPPSGSLFPIGTTTVKCLVRDGSGNSAAKSFDVIVKGDTTGPVLSLPAPLNAPCTSPQGAQVNFTATAADDCDGSVTVVCTPPSGSLFPIGTTTVQCVATDKAGNSTRGTFDVVVNSDCLKDCLSITCPADITVECAGRGGTAVEFLARATSRCSTIPPTVSYSHPPGSIFPAGQTVVTSTATDDRGNSATCQFTVTVLDSSAPVLTVPGTINAACTSFQGALVSFSVSATDACEGPVTVTSTPPSGSQFPIGTTVVNCVAQDSSGHQSTASFNVVVTGNCAADCISVRCPADITVSLERGHEIQVDYPLATAENTCTGQPVTVACYPPSGSTFHAGKNIVECLGTEGGNRQICHFTITVLDPIPPQFRRIPTFTKECDGLYASVNGGIGNPVAGAFVSFDIKAFDNADPNPTVVCTPPSGSFFPLGTNTVSCVATDSSGNSASSSFKVVVIPGPACEISANVGGGIYEEPPDNWGFELGLVSWKPTGSAFATNIQPILGDRVATKRITGVKQNIEQKLGGDYWQDVTFPVGYQGKRWIGTAEGQIFGLPFVGEELTGTLLSKRFTIKHRYINFLMGGGADLGSLKSEVLVRVSGPGPQVEEIEGEFYTRADYATGHAEEIMHRLQWDVGAYIGKRAYIRLVDNSTTGHINVDDFRFSDLPVEQQTVRVGDKYYPAVVKLDGFNVDWDSPVWGFADLHTHPLSYLGFSGKIMHGEFNGSLGDCRCSHGGWGLDNTCGNYWRQLLQMAMDDKGNDAHGFGIVGPNVSESYDQYWRWKQFRSWPTFSTVTHQQMYVDWLKRAYDGGLRVMVALCVNNQLLAHASRGDLPGDDKAVSELQIKALKDWVDNNNLYPKYSWVEIAYDPVQMRDIVRRNKMAIIIGSELDDFGNFASNPAIKPNNPDETSKAIVRAEVDRMYNLGVRYIFPIHLMDNTFGGTAIGSDMLNFATKFLMRRPFAVTNAPKSDQINFWLSDFNTVKVNIDGQNFSFDPTLLTVVGSIAGAVLIPALGPIVGAVADAMFPVAPGSGAALGAGLAPIMTVAMIGALPVLVAAIADSPIPLDIAPLPGNYPSYPDKSSAPYGVRNAEGLTKLGRYAIDYMMSRGMMIDVDHMSQFSLNEMFDKASAVPGGYPVNSGHNSFRDLGIEVNENHRSVAQMKKIRELGGLMGVGWENGPVHDFNPDQQVYGKSGIDNDCAGTSKSFGQLYLYALEQMHGSHVAFGTDMDGLIPAPGPRFGPQSAFALPAPDNEDLIDTDHDQLDRAYDIGAQTDGVLYSPKHGKPLTTAAFVGPAVDPDKNTDGPRYSKGYRYNQDQRDFYAAIRIFYWFKERDGGIPSEAQTEFDLEQIKNGFHDSYPDKDRIKRYAFGMIKALKGWNLNNDEEKIGKAVVRNKLYSEGVPDYLDSTDKRTRYYRQRTVWDDYQEIFGGNTPLFRCSTDQKEWDYNFEGVAHYGLLPDFLQDLSNVGLKPHDMSVLFRSAEHFAQMWVKTVNAADAINHPELHPIRIDAGIIKLQWFAQDGDELEEADQIGDSSSWRRIPIDLQAEIGPAEATIQLNTNRARFFRVRKK